MDVELLLATCEHAQRTGIASDPDSFRPLQREAAVRDAWRILDRADLEDQINQIGDQP
jgi:hypothetical protein